VKGNSHSLASISEWSAYLIALVRTRDTGLALGLTLLCIITRVIAIPASLWEWDDVLFARALHHFDITAHSPHPPGFPVFVMLGRAGYALLGDEHLAYAAISFFFGSFLSASLFYFYREVFQDSAVALAGALIGTFAPNVWVHGSAPRSDGPALTLGIIGLTLAIRGLRSRHCLLIAGVVFGLSLGVRVTLLPVMGPALAFVLLARLRARQWRLVGATLAIAAAGVLSWYVPLVLYTGWHVYRSALAQHAQYTLFTDSMFATNASAMLAFRLHRFFMGIWGTPWIMWVIYTCSALGMCLLLLRRQWRAVGWLAVSFLPITAFTLVINTPLAAPLYSLPYIPLFAGLAAFGIVRAPRLVVPAERWPVMAHVGLTLAGGVVIGLILWTYPIVGMLRSEKSPPVRAAEYLRKTLDPNRDLLYHDRLFLPHVIFYLPQLKMRHEELVADVNLINPLADSRDTYGLTTDPWPGVGGRAFRWSSPLGARRLRGLSMGRYFDVYVTGPIEEYPVVFLAGWYPQERRREETWRWMGDRSETALYVGADRMTLRLRAAVPRSLIRPTVVLRLDGVELDRHIWTSTSIDRTLTVRPDRGRMWSMLTIETDRTVVPSRVGLSTDDRELGLECYELGWSPAEGSSPTVTSRNQFLGPGWYPLESDGGTSWRWTKERAVAYLPPVVGDGRLEVTMLVPERSDGGRSAVTIEVAGQVLDRFQPPMGRFTKTYRVPLSLQRSAPVEMTLLAEPVTLAGDPRQVALLVTHLGWLPAAKP